MAEIGLRSDHADNQKLMDILFTYDNNVTAKQFLTLSVQCMHDNELTCELMTLIISDQLKKARQELEEAAVFDFNS